MACNSYQKCFGTFQIGLALYILLVAPIIHKETEKQNERYKPLRIY